MSSTNLTFEEVRATVSDLPLWGKTVLAGGVAVACYVPYAWWCSRPRSSPLTRDYKQGVVYLYQYPRTKQLPTISAASLKIETWLRLADIPYENKRTSLWTRALDGSMPFVELDGREISHPATIIKEVSAAFEKDIDGHLSDEQRVSCLAFERMLDLSLSLSHLAIRAENADKLLSLVPPKEFGLFAPIVQLLSQKAYIGQCVSALSSASFAHLTREQRIEVGKEDLVALSTFLGAKHYFTGFKPTTIDASLFGLLAQIAYAPYDSPHGDLLKGQCSNLFDFCERMKGRYWPDWNEATNNLSTDSNWKKKAYSPRPSSRPQSRISSTGGAI